MRALHAKFQSHKGNHYFMSNRCQDHSDTKAKSQSGYKSKSHPVRNVKLTKKDWMFRYFSVLTEQQTYVTIGAELLIFLKINV